jgi:hypothetical protein
MYSKVQCIMSRLVHDVVVLLNYDPALQPMMPPFKAKSLQRFCTVGFEVGHQTKIVFEIFHIRQILPFSRPHDSLRYRGEDCMIEDELVVLKTPDTRGRLLMVCFSFFLGLYSPFLFLIMNLIQLPFEPCVSSLQSLNVIKERGDPACGRGYVSGQHGAPKHISLGNVQQYVARRQSEVVRHQPSLCLTDMPHRYSWLALQQEKGYTGGQTHR